MKYAPVATPGDASIHISTAWLGRSNGKPKGYAIRGRDFVRSLRIPMVITHTDTSSIYILMTLLCRKRMPPSTRYSIYKRRSGSNDI